MLFPPHKLLVKTALEEKDEDLPASWLVFTASSDLPIPEIPSLFLFPLLLEENATQFTP